MLSPFLFVVMIDVVTIFARDGALSELLCDYDLFLMSQTIKGIRNKILKWKEAFESKGLKVSLGSTKVMVLSSSITQDDMSNSKVEPCGVCSLRVKANSVLCVQCGKWIHGTCARLKRVTQSCSEILHAGNVKGILERLWSGTKSYAMKWKP